GEEGARLAAESHGAAIDHIEAVVTKERIACDFGRVDGYLFNPPGGSPIVLYEEREAARKAGLAGVDIVPRAPIDDFDTGPALRFPRQGQFDPMKYLVGLALALERRGGRVYAGTHVRSVEGGGPARVTTQAGPA